MEESCTVQNIIDDLKRYGRIYESTSDEAPEEAARYLVLNTPVIKHCLKVIYTEKTKEQREELLKNHKELHYSATSDDFLRDASHCIEMAQDYHPDILPVRKFALEDLIRALEYGKYCIPSVPKLIKP
jgi:hypothetical protein